MIKIYTSKNEQLLEKTSVGFENAVWIDIINPTQEEEWLIENHFNVSVPSITEIDDIEVSRRFYSENKIHYLTAYMFSVDNNNQFKSNSVRFILLGSSLITVRYSEINSFLELKNLVLHGDKEDNEQVLLALLKSSIYHFADILEQIGFNIDIQTKNILTKKEDGNIKNDFRVTLQNIGSNGDLTAKAREGLISINRLLTYIIQDHTSFHSQLKSQMTILGKDIAALNDHTFFLSNQINFLLEATLGMINIEQNIAIKVFSVASMIFLPPTLIASIYGMNFTYIPGLSSKHGYIIAASLMVLSAYIPYKYFKKHGWF
jgi:magnesium transporter